MRRHNRKWKDQPRHYPIATWVMRVILGLAVLWALDRGCDKWAEGGPVPSLPVEVRE